jgi:diguanylate cyclase (GGDEF)-like protein/PAS domain S-box-containing protein
MDTDPEEEFDRLARLAARLFDVPIVLITLLDRERQFFKSHVGTDICETSREVSFCSHAIAQDDIMIVPDATKDPRFFSNPLVLGPPFIQFYAGEPLVTPTGEKVGTICLIDHVPRPMLSGEDRQNLADIAALVMDHLETHRLEYVKAVSQTRFENIAATSPDAIICSDANGHVTFWNRSAERLFGYTATEILNRPSDVLVPDSWRAIYEAELGRLEAGERLELADATIELSGLRKDGTEFPAEFSLSSWTERGTTSIGAIVRDVTERKQNEERLFRLASLDPLTDLPNRAAWQERLTEVVDGEIPATVLLLDLDGFKDVNDTLGHSAGDAVLKGVAARLQDVCADAIMLARLGGDEFVVLLPGHDEQMAKRVADRLIEAIAAPYDFAGEHPRVGASVGISLFPQHGITAERVLRAADLALYRVKESGKGRAELFTAALREVADARRSFEAELKHAFESGEFELYYQPQVTAADNRVVGAEALIRWNHPARGLLTPASFIDVLSHKPSAPAIGEWILRAACDKAGQWRRLVPEFRIGVNLFEAQLRSGALQTTVQQVITDTGLPPAALELEIVENILLRNDASTLSLLQGLRDLGVGLAFDDYGTGYASLSLLKRYPVNRLKIDRSFVRNVDADEENKAVVRAILYLAHTFGMGVIAEGVETTSQAQFLTEAGCPELQGYLYGRPMTAADFEQRLP